MVEKDVIAARLEEGDAGRSVMSRYLNLKHQMIGFATATVVLVCASLWFVEDERDASSCLPRLCVRRPHHRFRTDRYPSMARTRH